MPGLLEAPPEPALNSREIRFPPEILGKIYLENDLPHYPSHKGSRYPPMAVSKSWRNAALSHPQLWIRITINQYSDLRKSSPDTLRTWLRRSKPHLLEVVLRLSSYVRETEMVHGKLKPKDADLFQPIMKVLFAQVHRWGTLDLRADDWQFSHIFQVLNRARRLRDLALEDFILSRQKERPETLYDQWAPSEVPKILLPSVISLKFSLHFLSIDAFPFLELPNLAELAFGSGQIEFGDLMGIMKHMPKLDLLRLEPESGVSCNRIPLESAESADTVSDLGSLVVWNCFTSFSFLPHLARHCPNLRDITIHFMYCQELPSFPVESLEEITLVSQSDNESETGLLSYAEALSALKLGPNARELTLAWEGGGAFSAISFDPFIQALASGGDGDDGVMLKLEHLTIETALLEMSMLLEMHQVRSAGLFKTVRNDAPFYLSLEGCYGLPDIERGSYTEVKQLFEDPPEVNMTFSTYRDPYALDRVSLCLPTQVTNF